MWAADVLEPRMVAVYEGPLPTPLEQLRVVVSQRYGVEFDSCLVRRRGGGPTVLSLSPGEGDLVVMGGAMQHDWEHTVPRDARASGARMSVTLRHSCPPSEPRTSPVHGLGR